MHSLLYRISKYWYWETALLIIVGNKGWNLARNNCKFWVRFTCFDKSIQNTECCKWYHKLNCFQWKQKIYPHRLSKPLETKHGMYTSHHSNSNPKFQYQKQCHLYIVIDKAIMWCLTHGFGWHVLISKKLEKHKSWIIRYLLGYLWAFRA